MLHEPTASKGLAKASSRGISRACDRQPARRRSGTNSGCQLAGTRPRADRWARARYGTGVTREAASEAASATTAAERVLAKVRAAADARAVVEPYGSSVYAPAHASDVDVLVSEDDPVRLAAVLGLSLAPTSPPRLHGTIDGVEVDISVVRGDDEVARRARAGPRDAALLAARLREHDRDEAFQAAWPHVRRFVRARALGHNGLGWFGSFGWAVLLAVPLVADAALRTAAAGAVVPAWLR
ncbi:MAG TPA: hypothetical protein VHE35_27095, partial [Kofleriaceae bacterium]|nr:hypothetical protein [Kofleriaceae bacterium]